ncbi:MAG: DNA repair protein RadA [Candidatus Blackburnbacteria bacterium]|nr:DNA repair protein RadA [Candidatus Blackburnbacteria bacterium]
MVKASTQYVCQQCGYASPKWMGQCPNCGQWNSLVETVINQSKFKSKSKTRGVGFAEPVRLSDVKKEDYTKRIATGIGELDRVLGGGIVTGMVVLIAGEPGIGKSTLLLQIADRVDRAPVIYIAGEESATQIANRASRLGVTGENISLIEETDVDDVISQIGPTGLIIIDSIQTLTTQDLTGSAGSVGQVRECTARLTSWAKKTGTPLFIVGHVTKEGTIAGPRVLEHMVDTVLWFEGDRRESLRIIRTIKNRFGPTDEVGIFSMEEKGLAEVTNPSNLFLGQAGKVPGSVVTVVMEGTRPMLVEAQALVVPTKLAFPKRSASGVDPRRVELIIAVLSRRVGLPLWEHDVFVNIAGGIRINDPGADLAIATAIASAFYDKVIGPLTTPTTPTFFAIGEVGLLGEVREVVGLERRTKEAKRVGFTNSITNKEAKTVSEAIRKYITSSNS